MVTESPVEFEAQDGHELSGVFIAPDAPRGGLLISAATGYPKEFYRRLAAYAADRGYTCLIYDYRGVNTGNDDALDGFKADVEDWGRLDFAAALSALSIKVKDKPIVTLGHSVGGHLIGFTDNYARACGHIHVSVGSGYWGHHKWPMPLLGLLLWWGYGPIALATKNYLPAGGLWSGCALPRGAFEQWRRWSNNSRYFRDDLETRLRPHHFEDVTAPIRSFVFSDDPIANPRTARVILDAYPRAETDMRLIKPADFGLKKIGHDGAFRARSQAVWDAILDEADALIA